MSCGSQLKMSVAKVEVETRNSHVEQRGIPSIFRRPSSQIKVLLLLHAALDCQPLRVCTSVFVARYSITFDRSKSISN